MRTPVASILALTEQLGRALKDNQAQLQQISRLSEHAQTLMRQMDGFSVQSRAVSEALILSERLVDDLIEEAVAQAEESARRKGITLAVVAGHTFFFVQVAAQLFVRAVVNMLMHALHEAEPGSAIRLQTHLVGNVATPAVALAISYQRARLAPEVDKSLADGLGWGLDLTQIVAERHDGTFRREQSTEHEIRLLMTLPCQVETDSGSD